MKCSHRFLSSAEVWFVQDLLHESLTWKERLLHISNSQVLPPPSPSPRVATLWRFFFVTMLLQWLTTAFSKVTTTSYNTQWWKTNGRLLHESLTDAFMNWYMHSLSNSPSNSLSNHWTNYFIKSINYFSISWLITELLNYFIYLFRFNLISFNFI